MKDRLRLRWRVPGHERAERELEQIYLKTGEALTAWASAEMYLASALADLADCDPHVAEIVFYTPTNFNSRLAIVQNLARHNLPPGPEARLFRRVLERFERLARARNAFVHSGVDLRVVAHDPQRSGAFRTRKLPHRDDMLESIKASVNDLQGHIHALDDAVQLLRWLIDGSTVTNIESWSRIVFGANP